ncbi:IS3 family transposase [Streptomyces sp. NPDC048737]|uniref:IS3 family transposase n=1 Tax=unclassified Streptomyces TaxID=2593676 RepID=UPI0034167D2C
MRYAFIDAERATETNPDGHSVALLCRLLGVSRSGCYTYLTTREAARERARRQDELVTEIRHLHTASRRAYGSPRITAALRRRGRRVNRKRVERLMREHGISGITRRRRRCLTGADRTALASPDLVGRDFTAAEPGTKLAGDITYLPTLAGWWYLATVIDLATPEVVCYAMVDHHRAGLVVDALRMAADRSDLKEGCITHSDRGAECSSREYRAVIRELGLRKSGGRTGSCYDNVPAESFFGLLKAEIGTTVWESHEQARADVFHFIEVEYNRTRLRKHPVYGYVTPLETRALTAQALAPAA